MENFVSSLEMTFKRLFVLSWVLGSVVYGCALVALVTAPVWILGMAVLARR